MIFNKNFIVKIVCAICFFILFIELPGIAITMDLMNNTTQLKIDSIRPWNNYSEEERTYLIKRWTPEKVQQVIEALKNKQSLPVSIIDRTLYFQRLLYDYSTEFINQYVEYKNYPTIRKIYPLYDLRGIPLNGEDLKGVDLSWSILQGANLSEANLMDALLEGTYMPNANLRETDFSYSKLNYAILESAELINTNFFASKLSYAILYGANCEEAFFWMSDLRCAQFADFDHGSYYSKHFPGGNSDAYQRNANLKGSNLLGSRLEGTIIGNSILDEANFTYAHVSNTPIDALRLSKAYNYRYIQPSSYRPRIPDIEKKYDQLQISHRQLKEFFAEQGMEKLAATYHYWENEMITEKSSVIVKALRKIFLKWSYGYGSKPLWLFTYSLCIILIFTLIYVALTIPIKTMSGIYLVRNEGENRIEEILKWQHGLLLANSFYFSILSFATFGYGVLKPRQWLEFFRLSQVEYKPIGWVRIFVGIEATLGIYIMALLSTIIFSKSLF